MIENDESRQLPGNPGDLFIATDIGTHRVVDTIGNKAFRLKLVERFPRGGDFA